MSRNLRALSARCGEGETLFERITAAAEGGDSLSGASMDPLARECLVSPASVLGTASFYDLLKTENRGKRAHLCNGTACRLSGRQGEARSALARHLSDDEIGEVACVGHCYRGGGFQVGERTLDADSVDALELPMPERAPPSEGSPPFFPSASRSVFGEEMGDPDLLYKQMLQNPGEIMVALSISGLRGRGGAGFPFARKLKACAEMPSGRKYVVCNADEGDPGAFSDRYLLERQPHRVLAGMLAAARACGADSGFLYVRAEYPEAVAAVTRAIGEFEETAACRESGFRFRVIRGAGSYVCGEETALLNSIEGLRPEVRVRPPFPAQEGLFGQPTLLSNVETLAAVPWILQRGGEAFAAIGNGRSTGTKLVSLDWHFNRPGVYEVPMGLLLERLIYDLAGGFRCEVKALQIGGPLGSVLAMEQVQGLTLDFESFKQAGFLLGHAGIIAIPAGFPMLDFLRHLFGYMADESCGKCVPCRLGTRKGQRMLEDASAGQQLDAAAFADLLETLELGSLCALGGGLPLPVRNILEQFAPELTPCIRGAGQ